ncbi:MAG: hypothetical protein ABGX83_05495 [Nitrospira sp.]
MPKGVPKFSKKEAEELEARVLLDFDLYAPEKLKIQTVEGKLESFQLNAPQKILGRIIRHIKSQGRLTRLVILKARREGVSTFTEGRFFWHTTLKSNRYAVCITHEPEATDFLFKMTKRYYDNLPSKERPKTKYNNKSLLEFDGLDSAFRVATAEKADFGSGQLVHYAHLSEVAKWPATKQKSILDSLLQCIPDEEDTEIIFESTAKGVGGEFYARYWACRYRYEVVLKEGKPNLQLAIDKDADVDNEYSSVFFPWFIFPKYYEKPPKGFTLTKEEKELVVLHGVNEGQLYWRRRTIQNKCSGNVNTFHQEYPGTPMEAFLSSGRPVFDVKKLVLWMKIAKPSKTRYECQLSTGNWIVAEEGPLRVWQEPKPARAYIIGADVAEGILVGGSDGKDKYDFSCADVVDHLTGDQVAQWHGKIDPRTFGRILFYLAIRYNYAWIGPERNNHGISTVGELSELGYKKLYLEMIPEPPNKPRQRFGWLTSKKTKPLIIDNLLDSLSDENGHGLICKETMAEMLTFKHKDDGKMMAEEGMHDDRVMSLAIARYLVLKLPTPRMMFKGGEPTFSHQGSSSSQKPPTAAWT